MRENAPKNQRLKAQRFGDTRALFEFEHAFSSARGTREKPEHGAT
jgi:hypothetical protein